MVEGKVWTSQIRKSTIGYIFPTVLVSCALIGLSAGLHVIVPLQFSAALNR